MTNARETMRTASMILMGISVFVGRKIKIKKSGYVIITRKLRKHLKELKKQGKITNERFYELRKKIKARAFKDKNHLKDYMGEKIQ